MILTSIKKTLATVAIVILWVVGLPIATTKGGKTVTYRWFKRIK